MAVLRLLGSESDLTSATNLGFAKLVRVYNSGASDLVVTQKAAGGYTLATVSVKTKDIVFIAKAGDDTLEGGAALKVVSIAFAN